MRKPIVASITVVVLAFIVLLSIPGQGVAQRRVVRATAYHSTYYQGRVYHVPTYAGYHPYRSYVWYNPSLYAYGYYPSYLYSPVYTYPVYGYSSYYYPYSVPSAYVPAYSPGYVTPTATASPAYIDVRVPSPDAEIWFGGIPTTQTGTLRSFLSPPLTPGVNYTYEIRARWTQGDSMLEQTRVIQVQAGQHLTVDFTREPLPPPTTK